MPRDPKPFDSRIALRFAAREVKESIRLKRRLSKSVLGQLTGLAQATVEALAQRRRVYLFGNGGSAADAQHIAAELQGRLRLERHALPVMALTTNTSILTAVSNDYRFERVFSRQVEGLVESGDIVIGLTTSGASRNVLAALRAARRLGAFTAAFTGNQTKKVKPLTDFLVAVPSRDTQRIQEVHILLGHIYCDLIERHFFARK